MAETNAHNARLLVIAPLRIERAAVRRGLPEALVLRSGMGAAQARSAALVAARIPAAAVAVAGFCGALAGGLRAGDVVVASEVRGPAGVIVCASGPVVAALSALGIERVRVGPVASVDHVVPGERRAMLAAEGALGSNVGRAQSASPARVHAGPLSIARPRLDRHGSCGVAHHVHLLLVSSLDHEADGRGDHGFDEVVVLRCLITALQVRSQRSEGPLQLQVQKRHPPGSRARN